MSCSHHFLNLEWPHHNWKREVVHTDTLAFRETDMWGRRYGVDHVLCHARLVCQDCWAVKDDGDCGCEPEEGAKCRARLEHLKTAAPSQH
jgi:hypothetical protein